MEFESIGQNIRKYRIMRNLRQEDLAEKTDLSTNYIGALERCEKIPSLETFITIVNVLGVSADMILCDVIDVGYSIKNTMYSDKLEKLSVEDRNMIYDVIDTLLMHTGRNRKTSLSSKDERGVRQ